MKQQALQQFPQSFKYQIQAQFPRNTKNNNLPISLEKKHVNAVDIAYHFNALWNRREKDEDRKQRYEKPSTGMQEFLSSDEDALDSDAKEGPKQGSKKRPRKDE